MVREGSCQDKFSSAVLYVLYEVLLIDASDDRRQASVLRQEFAGHSIQWFESIPSVCIQRNIGIERASGDWVLLLDDDIDLEADYILKLERYILANGGCGAVAGRLMQLESGTWTDQYPIKSFNELCWRFIFQLSVWGRIDKVRVPGVMKWCFEIINDFYRRKGNTLSLAGWPLITQWDASIVRTTIYSLGASLIKKEWLANAYDEVLDPYGIGDNYGAALHFPSGQQIHILGDARAYHHRVSENRLERTLASYRRILALHYFLVRDKKSFVTRFFFCVVIVWKHARINAQRRLAHFQDDYPRIGADPSPSESILDWPSTEQETRSAIPVRSGKVQGVRPMRPAHQEVSAAGIGRSR